MNPLYQRLKELDSHSVEKLCFQLVNARHPTSKVRAVEGASGDKGVDSFQGDLDDGPAIWQVKAFPNGVGKSQRNQIRESLKTAVNNLHPRRWVLCINVDMDVHTHSWFQKLTKSRVNHVE